MSMPLSSAQNSRIGTCPHGMPPGACPICSGAGGGGGGSAKKADFSAKAGEMSWSECSAIGQMLKAQQFAKQQHAQAMQINPAINFQQNMTGFAQKLTAFAQNIQNVLPSAIAKPISLLTDKLLVPMLNILKDIPLNIQKTITQVAEKLADISDKLTAMFGELKSSVEKKISDKLKDFKKKIKSLFSTLETREMDDEDKIDEEKRIFEQKTALNSIKQNSPQNKKEDELNDED